VIKKFIIGTTIIFIYTLSVYPLKYIYAKEINFFVDYNFITFSSFNDFITKKPKNFNIYLEYNPFILSYLNWNRENIIPELKTKIIKNSIQLFKSQTPTRVFSPQEKWLKELEKK